MAERARFAVCVTSLCDLLLDRAKYQYRKQLNDRFPIEYSRFKSKKKPINSDTQS